MKLCTLVRLIDVSILASSYFYFGKIFHFFVLDQFIGPKCFGQVFWNFAHMCVCNVFILLCKKICVFGHCLKLHVYFELCTSHHCMYHLGLVEHSAMSTLLCIIMFCEFHSTCFLWCFWLITLNIFEKP